MESDFKKLFDVSTLSDQEIGMVEFVLNSPAYADYFEPYLLRMRVSLDKLMYDRSLERKNSMPDDFIAGGVAMIDGLTVFFRRLIEETRMERIARAQASETSTDAYDRLRATGRARGSGQVDQPEDAQVYDPAQDF
jgi:hypothetical protein